MDTHSLEISPFCGNELFTFLLTLARDEGDMLSFWNAVFRSYSKQWAECNALSLELFWIELSQYDNNHNLIFIAVSIVGFIVSINQILHVVIISVAQLELNDVFLHFAIAFLQCCKELCCNVNCAELSLVDSCGWLWLPLVQVHDRVSVKLINILFQR